MQQIINMVNFRKRPGEILNKIYYQKDTFFVKRGNKLMAVFLPIELYQALVPDSDIEIYSQERVKEFGKEDRLSKKTKKKINKFISS